MCDRKWAQKSCVTKISNPHIHIAHHEELNTPTSPCKSIRNRNWISVNTMDKLPSIICYAVKTWNRNLDDKLSQHVMVYIQLRSKTSLMLCGGGKVAVAWPYTQQWMQRKSNSYLQHLITSRFYLIGEPTFSVTHFWQLDNQTFRSQLRTMLISTQRIQRSTKMAAGLPTLSPRTWKPL
jgi:hypothetical protein